MWYKFVLYFLGQMLWESDDWISIVCAAHRLQNAIKHAIEKRTIQNLLAKCRRLVGYFKHSALATSGLAQRQKALGFKNVKKVVQEVPTRWNSTFHMLQRLVLLKQPIRVYLEDVLSESERASYDLSDTEWAIAKSILILLEAVDEVTTVLSGEKYSTLPWCLPLLFGLRDCAKPDDQDSQVLACIKRKLTDQLNERFNLDNLEIDSPFVLASALDPRFRKLSFLSSAQRKEVVDVLVSKTSNISCSRSGQQETQPVAKKRQMCWIIC